MLVCIAQVIHEFVYWRYVQCVLWFLGKIQGNRVCTKFNLKTIKPLEAQHLLTDFGEAAL